MQPTYQTIDAVGDDYGPYNPQTALGTYTLPTDPSFGSQMDLQRITVLPENEAILLSLEMGELSNGSEAPNGFDRAAFTIFFDVQPDAGAEVMPFLNSPAPEGIAWDYMSVVDGWNNAVYAADTADAGSYGSPVTAVPTISINQETNTIDLLYPRPALGNLDGFENVKIYITTWDWDDEANAPRGLTTEGGEFLFGGGDGTSDPLILDDAFVGLPGPYRSPIPPAPQVAVSLVVTVPENTPADAELFITGEYNNWETNDSDYQFTNNGDGTYTLTLMRDEGSTLEYRITRGTLVNAEKLDPDNRFANRLLEVPMGVTEHTVDITVEGWWDD